MGDQKVRMRAILFCAAALCGFAAFAESQREIQWGVTFGFYAPTGYMGSDKAKEEIDAIAAAGANWVTVVPIVWQDSYCSDLQYKDFCRAISARVSDLKTVQVFIEPLRPNVSNIVNYVFQGLAICREVASPRLAQLADIYHMMMGGDEPRSIVDAGALLRHVHIADYQTRMFPGADRRETWRFKPFFAALKAVGYTGGVSCECSWGDAKDFAKNAKTAIETMKELV